MWLSAVERSIGSDGQSLLRNAAAAASIAFCASAAVALLKLPNASPVAGLKLCVFDDPTHSPSIQFLAMRSIMTDLLPGCRYRSA